MRVAEQRDDTMSDSAPGYFVEGPTLKRVGPLTGEQVAALVRHKMLPESAPVWVEGTQECLEAASVEDRHRPSPPPSGLQDIVLAILPPSVLRWLPRDVERRRELASGVLDAVPDFLVAVFFLGAYLIPSAWSDSLRSIAGYLVAIEMVAVWGGFFLDAAYASGQPRRKRAIFGIGFLVYYGGIILGIGLLGMDTPWPALYALFALGERLPRIVRTLRGDQERIALETFFRALGECAWANLSFVLAFGAGVDFDLLLRPGAPSDADPWLIMMSIYLIGQGLRKILASLLERRISAYVAYCVAYNMLGRV